MFSLFDANVWISQLGLQTRNGAAVRHFAKLQGATVAIPEIVHLEVEERLAERLLQLRQQAEKAYHQLLPVLGKLQSIHLPSEEQIRTVVANIIPDLDVPIRRMPLNLDAARSSMMRVLRKTPPSASTEQFRDGVIWAHCLELLAEGDVYLVSEDKDFYAQRDHTKGLAPELAEEMGRRSEIYEVKLNRNLIQLMDEIRMPFRLDKSQLFNTVKAQLDETVEELLNSHGFGLCGHVRGQINCFATEEAQKVYFDFNLVHPCQDNTGAGRHDGELTLAGSGFLDPETKQTKEVKPSSILLRYPDWEPGGPARGHHFVSMGSNAGGVHTIRFPLDPPESADL